MKSEIILQAARAALEGTKLFPGIVGLLLAGGVEYYHVDYVGLHTTFYGPAGDTVTTPIPFEGLPPVAADFCAEALRA